MLFSTFFIHACLVISSALGAPLRRFEHLVVFGDSLSDSGKGAWVVSNHTWPADPHYYGHRFSNGRVYAEDLASFLSASILDVAVGGATTNNTLVAGFTGPNSTIPSPSILDQISTFLASRRHQDLTRTLFVVYGGANNAFFGLPGISVRSTVEDLKTAVKVLKAVGAKHFLIPTLPPVGRHYPFAALVPSYAPLLANFSEEFRTRLVEYAETDDEVLVPDFYQLYQTIFEEPEKFGFNPKKLSQSCLKGVYMEVPGGVTVCKDPREYVWWDEYHPTKQAHHLMAVDAYDALKLKGWC